jgi:hypothetical protein
MAAFPGLRAGAARPAKSRERSMHQRSFAAMDFARLAEKSLIGDEFSHGGVTSDKARVALEERYGALLAETQEFDRQLVSFQANKTKTLHSWIKYREGFSAELVEILLSKFGARPGDVVLDPFAGSCTTLLCAKMLGIDAVGIEILPHSHLAWDAKSRAFDYDPGELRAIKERVVQQEPPLCGAPFPHLRITWSAFPEATERDLMDYSAWFERMDISDESKTLCRFVLMSILERVSYTRKDGQYLRWDGRAQKIVRRNKRRADEGKKPIKGINKGALPSVREAFLTAFTRIITDVVQLQHDVPPPSKQQLVKGSTLFELPLMPAERFSMVVTSPPYANRYDYTRTYALELAYLGVAENIFDLRQRQLSCTVESKPKLERLEDFYRSQGIHSMWKRIANTVRANAGLSEVSAALRARNDRGEINNTGVLTMVDQYFTELAFVFAELHRTVRSGGHVAFVNDNVRYAGEIIPVDLLSTDLAVSFGFEPLKVFVLPQRKGNSSQQMGRYGRAALRKSITIWRKP